MSFLGSTAGADLYEQIAALMPPHDLYIEPFVGSGALLAGKDLAPRSIALDRNAMTIRLLKECLTPADNPHPPNIELIHGDGLAYLAQLKPAGLGRVLLYVDPASLHCTTTSRNGHAREQADVDHAVLAAVLTRLAEQGCAVIIAGSPLPLYDVLFADWKTREFEVILRAGVRTEKIWFNFEPGASHFPTFAGKDRTDRQRIKRKADRWAENFRVLPPAERQAVLAALLAARDAA